MLIKAGSSKGAMWLYSDMTARMLTLDMPATQEDVTRVLDSLCPEGWRFRDNNGQWGLWPDDLLKYYTHGLLYLSWVPKMREVSLK